MSGGGFSIRAGNQESNSIRCFVSENPQKKKKRQKNAGHKSNTENPTTKSHESVVKAEAAAVSSQPKDEVEEMTGCFKSLLSSIAQVGLENFVQQQTMKKYCGRKQDKRTPPEFLREFESSVLTCLDDQMKAQYFAKVFDYDLFSFALAIPFHKGYKAARQYFLEMTWNDDIQSLEFQKMTMSDEDRELFGYNEDDEETFDLYEAEMIKLYIRARDCGVTSSMGFKNLLYSKLPMKFRDEIKLKEYESLESFAAALHQHFVVSKVREECGEIEDHNAFIYKFITGKSYYTGETASDSSL